MGRNEKINQNNAIKIESEGISMNKINPREAVEELTMILMYLTRFKNNSKFSGDLDLSWKGYHFDVINELEEKDVIRQGSHRSKRVVITEEGLAFAKELLKKYNIQDWE